MIERARPRDGLGVRARTGVRAGLLGDFDFAPTVLCAGRGFSDWVERLRSDEEEGGLFSLLTLGVALNVVADDLEWTSVCLGLGRTS